MQIPRVSRIRAVPIFHPGPLPQLRPRVLVCGVEPIVDELRTWTERAERAPESLYWSSAARIVPHVVLFCGEVREARDEFVEQIADWRHGGAVVAWFASVEAAERDGHAVAAPSVTIVSPRSSRTRRTEGDDLFRITRAAQGLLHPLLSDGGICVDAADLFGVLTSSRNGIVYHFDAAEGIKAVKDAHPIAREILRRSETALLAATYAETSEWLHECCTRIEACRAVLSTDADIVTTLNFKRGNGQAEAELYLPV